MASPSIMFARKHVKSSRKSNRLEILTFHAGFRATGMRLRTPVAFFMGEGDLKKRA